MDSDSHFVRMCSLLAEMGVGFKAETERPAGDYALIAMDAAGVEISMTFDEEGCWKTIGHDPNSEAFKE